MIVTSAPAPSSAKAAFSELVLQEDASSEPIELTPNHVVVIRVNQHLPSSQRVLTEVKDDIQARLKADEALKKAQAKAEEIIATVATGETLQALAEADGLAYQLVEKAGRQDSQYGLPVVTEVFKLAATDRAYHAVAIGEGYAVIQQSEVFAGNTGSEAEATQYKQVIANSAGVVENAGVLAWLRSDAKIHINESKLEGNTF